MGSRLRASEPMTSHAMGSRLRACALITSHPTGGGRLGGGGGEAGGRLGASEPLLRPSSHLLHLFEGSPVLGQTTIVCKNRRPCGCSCHRFLPLPVPSSRVLHGFWLFLFLSLQTHLEIRKWLEANVSPAVAAATRIQYGGTPAAGPTSNTLYRYSHYRIISRMAARVAIEMMAMPLHTGLS